MLLFRHFVICLTSGFLASCGTYVPSLRDWPNNNTADETIMVGEIARSVRCELRRAITTIIDRDIKGAGERVSRRRYTDFLNNWGVEFALNLTFIEKGSINPSGSIIPPSPATAVLTLVGGGTLSSQATREDRSNVFYTVKELYHPGRPNCVPTDGNQHGSPLVESNLRLLTLLDGRIGSAELNYAKVPQDGEKNVLSQTVSFQIVTSGTITPSVQLVRGSINSGSGFLTGSRDRKQEAVFTFGPMDRAKGGRSLIAIAEQVHVTAQIASSFRTAVNAPQ